MLVINSSEVVRALPMPVAIDQMKEALVAIALGQAVIPVRTHIDVPAHAGTTLVMPCYVTPAVQECLSVKVVSVFDNNPGRGEPRIQAAVLVLDPQTGRPQALIEGAALTALRTAAASGAATDVLARPDAEVLAVLGAGVQARTHLQAVCAVRRIGQARVYGPTPQRVDRLVAEIQPLLPESCELVVAQSPNEAIRDADIICTVSTSRDPLFDDACVKDGTHINAVGSYKPDVCEIPTQTVCRARVFVDQRGPALQEAGDLIQPMRSRMIDADHILAEVGEVLAGKHPGRSAEGEITIFKSVGNAVEDALAARRVLSAARQAGLGQTVDW